jgi:colanic acid/amylovoran biosynthesis protein
VRNIMIRGFESLDNYGTGMMGLVAIDRLHRQLGGRNRFHVDLFPEASLDEVRAELGARERPDLEVVRTVRAQERSEGRLSRVIGQLPLVGSTRNIDLFVVLGGDTLSEVYTLRSWRYILAMRLWALDAPVAVLGHTIGPFATARNRRAMRHLAPALHVFPRDRWTTEYLEAEFGLRAPNVVQGTDLAWSDLPLQHRTDIRDATLAEHGLEDGGFATLIVSGLQAKRKFYTTDTDLYFQRYADLAQTILERPDMADARLTLLAHTHGKLYGDEPAFIREVMGRLPETARSRVVAVTDRVLQARARFILGAGRFTVTGRMHPAVSTFQMGKPAVSLAYSPKYEGVIGTMLGRQDLIIDAAQPDLWSSGAILDRIHDRLDYAAANRERLAGEIRDSVARQKALLDGMFVRVAALAKGAGAERALSGDRRDG